MLESAGTRGAGAAERRHLLLPHRKVGLPQHRDLREIGTRFERIDLYALKLKAQTRSTRFRYTQNAAEIP